MPPPDPLSSPPSLAAPLAAPRASDAEWLDPRFQKLLGVMMAFGYAFSSLLVVPKYLVTALHASPREIGELAAIPALSGIAVAPLCGRWLDRGGARATVLFGAALLALSVVPFGFFDAVEPGVYALRALQGVGNTLIMGGTGAFVTLLVAPKNHARAFGLAGSASLAMNAFASYTTERLADAYGWGPAFAVAGGFAAIALVFTLSIPKVEPQPHLEPAPSSTGSPGGAPAVTFAALAAGAAFATLATFTQPFVLTQGATDVAPLFIGYTATALAVRLGFGTFIDRWGRRRTALVSLCVYGASVLCAGIVSPPYLLLLGLGFGAAHGLAWPSLNALAVERAGAGRSGSALTRLHATFGVGAMGAVWGVGWLVGEVGYPLSFAASAWLVAGGALTLRNRSAPRAVVS
ncbi:MAG TPA: MFS transporter [Polyangiaceae bacterium]